MFYINPPEMNALIQRYLTGNKAPGLLDSQQPVSPGLLQLIKDANQNQARALMEQTPIRQYDTNIFNDLKGLLGPIDLEKYQQQKLTPEQLNRFLFIP